MEQRKLLAAAPQAATIAAQSRCTGAHQDHRTQAVGQILGDADHQGSLAVIGGHRG